MTIFHRDERTIIITIIIIIHMVQSPQRCRLLRSPREALSNHVRSHYAADNAASGSTSLEHELVLHDGCRRKPRSLRNIMEELWINKRVMCCIYGVRYGVGSHKTPIASLRSNLQSNKYSSPVAIHSSRHKQLELSNLIDHQPQPLQHTHQS